MRVRELMKMDVEQVEAMERQLWKEWELVANALKVLQAISEEEE